MLATKLFAPSRRSQHVARPRLAKQLDTTLDAGQRLTLVSAPAGFGKTTVLGDWLTHLNQRRTGTHVGWLSLDDGDNDLTRYLTHLLAALQSGGLDVDSTILEALPTVSTSAVLTRLVNEVTRAGEDAPGQQWVLVLDDYHAIGASDVHEAQLNVRLAGTLLRGADYTLSDLAVLQVQPPKPEAVFKQVCKGIFNIAWLIYTGASNPICSKPLVGNTLFSFNDCIDMMDSISPAAPKVCP